MKELRAGTASGAQAETQIGSRFDASGAKRVFENNEQGNQ